MNLEKVYLYSVNPKKPIKNLRDVPVIRTPKSLYLCKEDVYKCLQCGIVYRRFANEKRIERVTIANVDRMHNDKFMTEEEYKVFLDNEMGDTGKVVINPVEETPAPVEEVIPEQEVVETSAEDTLVVEETPVEEVIPEQEAVETSAKEVTPVIEDAPASEGTEQFNRNKKYTGKNKHH